MSCYLSSESSLEVYLAPISCKYGVFDCMFNHYLNISFPKLWVTKIEYRKGNWITHEVKNKKNNFIELSKLNNKDLNKFLNDIIKLMKKT